MSNQFRERSMQSLLRSFKYAGRGIAHCIKYERNMRVHIVFGIFALVFSAFYNFTKVQYILLLLAIALVLTLEMVNTAVENLVDLQTGNYDKYANAAKNIAAGAVFLASGFAVLIGVLLFFDLAVLSKIFKFFIDEWFYLPVFGVLIVLSAAFIFYKPKKICERKPVFIPKISKKDETVENIEEGAEKNGD